MEISNKNLATEYGPVRSGEQRRSVIDYKKFHEFFGWEPEIHLEQGLVETYNFFQNEEF
jgi:dTDP-D-glucose 4,6-dehydratase